MTFHDWLHASQGDFPAAGVAGVPTDWFAVGPVDLPGGRVSVTDLWSCFVAGTNLSTDVPPGRYAVAVRGLAFGDHRRTAGVRLTLDGSALAGRDALIGGVLVHSWGVVIGDVEAWHAGASDDDVGRLNEANIGRYADGCERITWTLADRAARLAVAFTGLGDGDYPVFAWVDAAGRRVGIECEFL